MTNFLFLPLLLTAVLGPPEMAENRHLDLKAGDGAVTAVLDIRQRRSNRTDVNGGYPVEVRFELTRRVRDGEGDSGDEPALIWSSEEIMQAESGMAIEPMAARLFEGRGLLVIAANSAGLCSYWFELDGARWKPPRTLRLFPFPPGPGNRLPFESVEIEMYTLPGEDPEIERGRVSAQLPLYRPRPTTFVFYFWFDNQFKSPFFGGLGRGVNGEEMGK